MSEATVSDIGSVLLPVGGAEAHRPFQVQLRADIDASGDVLELLKMAIPALPAVQMQHLIARFGRERSLRFFSFSPLMIESDVEIDWAKMETPTDPTDAS